MDIDMISTEANFDPDGAYDDLLQRPGVDPDDFTYAPGRSIEASVVVASAADDERLRQQAARLGRTDRNLMVDWKTERARPLKTGDIKRLIKQIIGRR